MVLERLETIVLRSNNALSLRDVVRYGGYAFDLYLDSIGMVPLRPEDKYMREIYLNSLHLPQRIQVGILLMKWREKDWASAKNEGINNNEIADYFWKNFIELGDGRYTSKRSYTAISGNDRYTLSVKVGMLLGAVYCYISARRRLFMTKMHKRINFNPKKQNPLRKKLKVISGGRV